MLSNADLAPARSELVLPECRAGDRGAALEAWCGQLPAEDLQAGRTIQSLAIVDPFAG